MTEHGQEPPARPYDPRVPPADPSAPVAPQAQTVPPEWGWVKPAVPMQTVETEPLEYHRLLRGTANYRWWKPLLLLLISGVYFGVLTVVVTLIFIPIMMAWDPGYVTGIAEGTVEILDTQRPVSILLAMVSIIIMIPSVLLGMLTMGMKPTGRVWSVAGRMRWGLLLRQLGVAAVAVIAMNAVGIGVGIAVDPTSLSEAAPEQSSDFDTGAALLSLLFIVLLVPLQSTAEEVVYRGLFMQVLGSWLRRPWFVILIPSIGFALSHIYDIWGLAAVGLMGMVAAWLTWKTGGLEAAIALHIVNNLIAFGFMTAGVGGETAQTSDAGGPEGVIGEVVGLALFAWLALKVFRRGGHGRERIDLIQVQAPAVQLFAPAYAAPAEGAALPAIPDTAPKPDAPTIPPAPEIPRPELAEPSADQTPNGTTEGGERA